ncbi:MAG: hypothetical protein GF347_03085 [Candidatus Moranbacteria bacterium]|nr:hypothetical protein [Candidatus Moranbacteria bacterium]
MKRITFLSQFKDAPFFTKQVMINSAVRFNISINTLNSYIKKALINREIISLKRNHYVTENFFSQNKHKQDYVYFIATKLLQPSYISRETALQYYGLLSEANMTVITCNTTKTSRKFENKLGILDYKSIKKDLFLEFTNKKDEFDFYIAKPHKAIFDYLYYRLPIKELRNESKVWEHLEDHRLNYEVLSKKQIRKFIQLIKSI